MVMSFFLVFSMEFQGQPKPAGDQNEEEYDENPFKALGGFFAKFRKPKPAVTGSETPVKATKTAKAVKVKKSAAVASAAPASAPLNADDEIDENPFKALQGLGARFERFQTLRLAPVFAVLALLSAMTGQALIKPLPFMGLLAFAASGLFLVLCRPEGHARMTELPDSSAPRERWEPWFVLGLVVLGLLTRFVFLGQYPATGIYSEGMTASRAMALVGAPYLAHDSGYAPWPTLWSYQAIFLAKFFGFTPQAFRGVSALWGVLSLPLIYIVARRMTSPLTAAMVSLLSAGFYYHLHFSMRFNPIILCVVVPVLVLGALLLGMQKKQKIYFIIAGFALGLSLHGYYALRIVAGVVGLWLAYLWLVRRAQFPSFKHLLWMLAAAVITAGPVIMFALQHPADYNSYIAQTNELKGQPVSAYFVKAWNKLPDYLRLYNVLETGDSYEDTVIGQPILHPVMRILAPMGLFFCLLQFWRPIPAFLVALFALGLLPGLLGGLFGFAASRRVMVAHVAVFFFAGLALERLRLGLNPNGSKKWGRALAAIGLLLAVWTVRAEWVRYREYNEHPLAQLRSLNPDKFLAGMLMQKNPQARVLVSNQYFLNDAWPFNMSRTENVTRCLQMRDFFIMQPGQEHLLLMDGALEGALPWFKAAFPESEIRIDRMKEKLSDEFVSANTGWIENYYWSAPDTYLISLKVSPEQVARLQSMLDLRKPGSHVAVWDEKFGAAQAGGNLSLGASVLLGIKSDEVTVKLPWAGWSLKVNGRPASFNRPVAMDGGINSLELSGPVPAGHKGAMPLSIKTKDRDLVGEHRVVALPMKSGMVIRYSKNDRTWGKKVEYSQRLLYPIVRLNEDAQLGPYTQYMQTRLTVPEDGNYELRVRWLGGASNVKVDGKLVTTIIPGADVFKSTSPVRLSAGKPVRLDVEWDFYGGYEANRVFLMEYKKNGEGVFTSIPAEWFDASSL